MSLIKKKKCKCSTDCLLWPDIGFEGYSRYHATQDVLDRIKHKQQRKNAIKKDLSILRKVDSGSDENKELSNKYDKLEKWFKEMRKEMTGVCCECGKTTSKHNDKYYKWSICHIVPKSLVPSAATNTFNWIELCQQHHCQFDNTFDKAAAMMCFGEVKQKFQLFKNIIPADELRKVNPHLLS